MNSKEALECIIWRLTSHEEDLELRETDKKEIEIIKQDLERLEALEKELKEKAINTWLANIILEDYKKLEKVVKWLKDTFEITLDSKLRISDGVDCIQAFPIDMKTNEVIFDLVKEVFGNE